MLNFDVKRKINTLRDILVGKVPDPKAQVEQITIALIYKFMDDMDLEGMEFGGSREFFKEEYEKYAWTNIMQPENSGQQRANLYAEGIDKMSMNPHLPQLFRDIFRGAYVPYRDAETLNMFLKEINDFSYDHSEDLGNAFEYLLSIMGSQGDAGQFRTPRHIIDMIVEIVDPQKTDSILDPACGTAGFLISSYKHILGKNKDKDGISTLSADERKRMTESFAGYDISPDMVRLSRVNMYLHKFSKPQINEYDTLSSLEKWDETYDVILANPPFMTPKGGIIPHNRYRIPAKRAEVLFVDYIAEHLNPTGRAGIIVPEGIVFQSANAYKALRKYLVEDDLLYAVISLPAGVFNPYSGVKTSILLFDRTLAKQKDEILFIKINNDGYDLGAQRRDVKGSDIPEAVKIIKGYQKGIDVSDNALVTIASKMDIAEQDYILVGERYKEAVVVNSDYPIVELDEIALEIRNGTNVTQINECGKYRVTRIQTIADGTVDLNKTKWTNDEPTENYFMQEGDILLSHINSYDHLAKTAIFPGISEKVVHGINLIRLRLNKAIVNPKYAILCMKSDNFINRAKIFAQKAVNQASIKTSDLKQIKIPLPPLHIQEEIAKEIEGYQKIIDGAKQVVDNYKPTIKIDPSWEMVKLGDVSQIIRGSSPRPAGEPKYYGGKIPRLMVADVTRDGMYVTPQIDFLTEEGAKLSRPMLKGELVMAVSGQPGTCAILNVDACIHDGFAGFKEIDNTKVDIEFLYFYLMKVKEENNSQSVGAVFKNLKTEQIRNFLIPIPDLKTQKKVVNDITEEMTIVRQNKRLIEMFKQKIKDKISEVWGE